MTYCPAIGLSAALENADDIALFDAARAADDGFRISAAVANSLLDGEQPVKVWREHRGLTQEAKKPIEPMGSDSIYD